jgi:hypothetical protein
MSILYSQGVKGAEPPYAVGVIPAKAGIHVRLGVKIPANQT